MSEQLPLPLARCCRIELGASRASWVDDAGRVHVEIGYPRCCDCYWRIFMGDRA